MRQRSAPIKVLLRIPCDKGESREVRKLGGRLKPKISAQTRRPSAEMMCVDLSFSISFAAGSVRTLGKGHRQCAVTEMPTSLRLISFLCFLFNSPLSSLAGLPKVVGFLFILASLAFINTASVLSFTASTTLSFARLGFSLALLVQAYNFFIYA